MANIIEQAVAEAACRDWQALIALDAELGHYGVTILEIRIERLPGCGYVQCRFDLRLLLDALDQEKQQAVTALLLGYNLQRIPSQLGALFRAVRACQTQTYCRRCSHCLSYYTKRGGRW